MESLFILIPIALLLVFLAVRIFMWAVKSGQFDDLDTEGKRILFDDERANEKSAKKGREPRASDRKNDGL